MSHTVVDGQGVLKYVTSLSEGTTTNPLVLVTMGYFDYSIHEGNLFGHTDTHVISNGGIFRYLIKTPSNRHVSILKLTAITTSAPVFISIYEDSIVSNNGTQEPIYNLNRKSANSTLVQLYELPTVTDNGVRLVETEIAGEKSIGEALGDDETFILKNSTNYIVVVDNQSGASASISFKIVFEDMESI